MERLKTLEAGALAVEDSLNQAPLDVSDVHPNLAELYRRKVERLIEALNDPEDRAEAATALRGLIDKIVLTPGARRGEISARLFGDLETVLARTHDQRDQRARPLAGFPGR